MSKDENNEKNSSKSKGKTDEKNRFILYGNIYRNQKPEKLGGYIWVYSTQTKIKPIPKKKPTGTWTCEIIQEVPKDFELIDISRRDKLYLLADNSIYEWNFLNGEMSGSVFINDIDEGHGRKVMRSY
jgi:hypothetical protein